MTPGIPEPHAASLKLEGELTIYRAEALKTHLLSLLEQASAMEVDLSSVSELDTAGVQVLLMIKQLALAHGKKVRLNSHSRTVLEVFEIFNLAAHFDDPLILDKHS